ncbi:extracellular catalytic domain type 2 short-chain-length polyhydroxyalkanoate depolymerase [Marinospirillum perlucidum]|uniref:extracellular catalytic domain type 2 short-chain-length polyhydroxyalkanoate depolymerase n=1 Tax=Marinospirillum perlucidum TaxID=1982602 RepID=UPI000DF16F7A|nr:PHB depolymerase family esterase [Marinospirillum perlucidum]
MLAIRNQIKLVLLLPLVLLAACAGDESQEPQLPVLDLDNQRFYVSGLSSGGYMAQQLFLAWPEEVQGIGIFAAGPYGCAREGVNTAILTCMKTNRGAPDAEALRELAEEAAAEEQLGDLSRLQERPVFIYQAGQDPLIEAEVTQALVDFYQPLVGEGLKLTQVEAAGHGFPTLDQGVDCSETAAPFVNACGFSGAGESLDYLDAPLQETVAAQPQAELKSFSQKPFNEDVKGLADQGYYYLPPACEADPAACGLQLVLHGCEQAAEKVGTDFIQQSGYLQQADARNLMLVFPQIEATLANPKTCWDWWGYGGDEFDTREGEQVQALRSLWQQLLNGSPSEPR